MTADRPSALGLLRYIYGGRLPVSQRAWVRRDLSDAGWRERVVLRVLVQVAPFVALGAFVPGPAFVRAALPALLLLSTLLIAAPFSEEIRDRRLRQHGLEPPKAPDGLPPPDKWPGMKP